MIFAIENGQFYYEDNLILQDICVSVEKGERIGIIGENGAGKTTLLNLIIGKLSLDEGEIFVRKNLAIGYLEQNGGLESENTVLEEMRLVFYDLLSLENKMRALEQMLPTFNEDSVEYRKCATEYSEAKKRFEGLDGYNVDVKIKTVLNGMGFLGLYERKCSTFSGGEKTRLAICKLLLQEPDLLILDEPTNHLDLPSAATCSICWPSRRRCAPFWAATPVQRWLSRAAASGSSSSCMWCWYCCSSNWCPICLWDKNVCWPPLKRWAVSFYSQ